MQRNVQVHVFCCGVQKDFAVDNNDHAVRSRQAVAPTTEWASMRGLLKAGEMSAKPEHQQPLWVFKVGRCAAGTAEIVPPGGLLFLEGGLPGAALSGVEC